MATQLAHLGECLSAEWEDVVSDPAQANNWGLIKTATIMLAVIQGLVSVQVITSCAVKLSCWPDSFILSYQEDGNFYCFSKREGNVDPPGLVVWPISQGGRWSVTGLQLLLSCTVVVTLPRCYPISLINSWGRLFFFFSHQKGAIIQGELIIQGRQLSFQIMLTESHALNIFFHHPIK